MIQFKAIIQKFNEQGEKTGWTYIAIPIEMAQQIKPNYKKSYRVKGKIDDVLIAAIALIPMGEGNFILPLNLILRKEIQKRKNEQVVLALEEDKVGYLLNEQFIDCLKDEPTAYQFFKTLAQGHQNYFSKWIESAKTIETKTKRIAMAVNALEKKWDYGTMIRTQTAKNKQLKGL